MDSWYLVHTKIRQERVALDNLERQGFECVMPQVNVERLRKGALQVVQEPLFPRYLFIRLGTGMHTQSWAPIRSTVGVSRLVTFGQTAARVDAQLVEHLRNESTRGELVARAFTPGDAVVVSHGPFEGVEAIYQNTDGDGRVMVLLSLLNKPLRMALAPSGIRKLN